MATVAFYSANCQSSCKCYFFRQVSCTQVITPEIKLAIEYVRGLDSQSMFNNVITESFYNVTFIFSIYSILYCIQFHFKRYTSLQFQFKQIKYQLNINFEFQIKSQLDFIITIFLQTVNEMLPK